MTWTTISAAAGLVAREDRLLMVRQHRPSGVWWEVPGGYHEADETYEQTAAREVLEETGIEVEVGALACTLVWEREYDRRRNVILYFLATPRDPAAEPRPQVEEDIDAAAFVDPAELGDEVHPLEREVIARWRAGETGFHVHADIAVGEDGAYAFAFRWSTSSSSRAS